MILEKMLDRLFRGLMNGPCLNARPHASKQRVDLTKLKVFRSKSPEEILQGLLGEAGEVEIPAKVPVFVPPVDTERKDWSPQQKEAEAKSKEQESLLQKIRQIAEDAADYENDHGESALCIGYPLLHIPPGPERTTRIVAPIAFISLALNVRTSARKGITLTCNGEGVDRVVPNPALMAWIRQQIGTDLEPTFPDEEGTHPWEEIASIVNAVSERLDIKNTPEITPETSLIAVARADELGDEASIISGAVIGLFPLANQGLLADTKWMIEQTEQSLHGPVKSFIKPEATGAPQSRENGTTSPEPETEVRKFSAERLITQADPCQAEAVRRAQTEPALVIHGPPGTGKSQTIANIIGDHAARGERVLFVCDKRTALDVVKFRLQTLGLGDLCALIHDPKKEQKALYMSLRDRLDTLAESPRIPNPSKELDECDRNLELIHRELTAFHQSLHGANRLEDRSFHQLFGQWLSLAAATELPVGKGTEALSPADVESSTAAIEEILTRAARVGYTQNPWNRRLGLTVGAFLQKTEISIAEHLNRLTSLSANLDQTINEYLPPLNSDDLDAQTKVRQSLAALVRLSAVAWNPNLQGFVQKIETSTIAPTLSGIQETTADQELIAQTPLDSTLVSAVPVGVPIVDLNNRIAALQDYLPIAAKWFRHFKLAKTKAAKGALLPLGLKLTPETVAQALDHYRGLAARLRVTEFLSSVLPESYEYSTDDDLLKCCRGMSSALTALQFCTTEGSLRNLDDTLKTWMAGPEYVESFAQILELSANRSGLLAQWENEARDGGLLNPTSINDLSAAIRGNSACAEYIAALASRRADLEDIVRLESLQDSLPPSLQPLIPSALNESLTFEQTISSLRKLALANQIRLRIKASPHLQELTSERIDAQLNAYLRWTGKRRELTTQLIQNYWQNKARKELLSSNETRLNGNGTALKQRLLTRGAHALKLRKMLEVGQSIPGGDPLFDLCPIWMSGPNTVAQIFPKKALFDVVIFDEASQCRLEEALPVLLRAKRVVVAGDPKQLPPTRFFESGITESENEDIEDTDQLFETQQSETEDLLGAALNISVRESYLDVHYRSSNSALINFSNDNFYGGRLQAIPAHPNSLAEISPVRLIQVAGLYKDRTNPTEAEKIVAIVDELLSDAHPPSIGIACFNLTQRETISSALDARAQKDPVFAQRLAAARTRQGPQSFEGLFVKNLENVQGDERDHMIISTTFGINEEGKFRRSFGPLSKSNGGRRLNVLVTRAREMVHVVTSIPRSEYMAAYDVPPGSQPNGRLLLYDYLKYVERIEAEFKEQFEEEEKAAEKYKGKMIDWKTEYPSVAAVALGTHLHTTKQMGGITHWGNDGFCVDVAIRHPEKPLRVTIGVLADFTRYGKAPDLIEWEAFRYSILVGLTKWKLIRTWSPATFRALSKVDTTITDAHAAELAQSASN